MVQAVKDNLTAEERDQLLKELAGEHILRKAGESNWPWWAKALAAGVCAAMGAGLSTLLQ